MRKFWRGGVSEPQTFGFQTLDFIISFYSQFFFSLSFLVRPPTLIVTADVALWKRNQPADSNHSESVGGCLIRWVIRNVRSAPVLALVSMSNWVRRQRLPESFLIISYASFCGEGVETEAEGAKTLPKFDFKCRWIWLIFAHVGISRSLHLIEGLTCT